MAASKHPVFDLIQRGVYGLFMDGARERDIMVAFSPITEMILIRELQERYMFTPIETPLDKAKRIFGCEIFGQHFNNNEIVIYDKSDMHRERKVIIQF